jgi:type II secretory pathway pseudopilin PulG
MALVLVVVGVILGIGTSAWMSINDARRITMTGNRMQAAKNCLITRVVNSHRYPSYTSGYGSPAGNGVDACVGERLDGWGGPIYFMEGFRPDASALSGGCLLEDEALPSNHPCGSDNAPVLPSDDSEAIDKDGNTVEDVAFILVSFGEDATADDASYGGVLDPPLAVTMDASTDPDFEFNTGEDDVVLIVTVHDLLAAIARSEQ